MKEKTKEELAFTIISTQSSDCTWSDMLTG